MKESKSIESEPDRTLCESSHSLVSEMLHSLDDRRTAIRTPKSVLACLAVRKTTAVGMRTTRLRGRTYGVWRPETRPPWIPKRLPMPKLFRTTSFVLFMIFGIPALIALPFLLSGFIGRM